MVIPTTFEMDKLFTETDINNRFFVMKPCVSCYKYSKHDIREETKTCPYCGKMITKNGRYWYSIRTWDNSKKISAADQKKLG